MIVMKFGGSVLSSKENISKTHALVKKYLEKDKIILVVSAVKGITDKLYAVVDSLKSKRKKKALHIVQEIANDHYKILESISSKPDIAKTKIELLKLIIRLESFIKNIGRKPITAAREDFIVSFGERLSCYLVTAALDAHGILAYPIDSSFLIATNARFGSALPLYKKSQEYIDAMLKPLIKKRIVPVVTGFIGFTHDGCTTTLGRGGSDLSAAFLANFLDAKALYLWKDVEGFYSGNPHTDKNAILYERLSYEKAENLAKDGAKVLYYKAIGPVKKKNIPIYIKSFIKPDSQGTVIQ